MARKKRTDPGVTSVEGGAPMPVVKAEDLTEEVKRVDYDVLDAMGKTNRSRLTRAGDDSLTLRQKQAAGAEYLATLVAHPAFRKRLVEESMKDPVTIYKIASNERPKEIHLEAEVAHQVVVVPAPQTAEEWERSVKVIEGEVVKEEW